MDIAVLLIVVVAGLAPLALLPVAARLPHSRGAGLCAECGYDLAGLGDEGACPECATGFSADQTELGRLAEMLVWGPMWAAVGLSLLTTIIVGVFSLGILLGPALVLSTAVCILPVLPLCFVAWVVAQRSPRTGARLSVVGSGVVLLVVASAGAMAFQSAAGSPVGGQRWSGLVYLAMSAPIIAGLSAPTLGAIVALAWRKLETGAFIADTR